MTGHTKWLGANVDKAIVDEGMIPYHQGYILAVQDLLDDYARMMRSGTYTRERFHAQMKSSLRQAQLSLGRIVSEKEKSDTFVAPAPILRDEPER